MGSGRGRGRGLREVEEADKNKWKAILVEGKGATEKKKDSGRGDREEEGCYKKNERKVNGRERGMGR